MAERYKNPVTQYMDDSGDPIVEGKLYFYENKTLTAKNTYADLELTIPNSNPVILDGSGRIPNIFLDGVYTVIFTNSDDVQEWQRDNVGETGFIQFGEWEATKTYGVADIVQASTLDYYRSLTDNNLNNNPTSSPSNWELILVVGEDATGRGSDYVPWTGESKTVTEGLDDHEARIDTLETGFGQQGAFVYASSAQTVSAGVGTNLSFDTVVYNNDAIYAAGSPTRLTVPTGITQVVLKGGAALFSNTVVTPASGDYYRLTIYKNGALTTPVFRASAFPIEGSPTSLIVESPILEVTAGDYFELNAVENFTGSTVDAAGAQTWFSMEVIQRS